MTRLLAERKYLRQLLRRVDAGSGGKAVVLVGSWARGAGDPLMSDLDVLVVDGQASIPPPPPQVQLVPANADDVRARVLAGDEFLQWSLRYGVPLAGKAYWRALRDELLPIAAWPKSQMKIEQAEERYRTGQALFEIGDLDAARAEARLALSHLARARLLDGGIFPLSRPELASQLRAAGESDLAHALEDTIRDPSLSGDRLRSIFELLGRELRRPTSENAANA
jgi:Nucleotidyltransferase domain